MTKKLLMGNEAFAHAALEAGVRVVAGYPGTPSSELVETVARLRAHGSAEEVYVEWSTNEKAALEVVAGAAYCGARTLFTCKQVGLNVASDALMSLNYVGVSGGTVLFVADDPGPISSQTEQDTRRFAAFAKVPVLDPATPDQGFAMMKAAFDLSERYHTPVIVRPTTRICHASTFFEVADTTRSLPLPEEGFVKDSKWVIFPKRSYEAHGEIIERLSAMSEQFSTDPVYQAFNPIEVGGTAKRGNVSPHLGIVAGGVSAAYVREALDVLKARALAQSIELPPYAFMQIGTPYPFPEQAVAHFAQDLSDIIVFEELDYVLEEELLKLTGARKLGATIHGKLTHEARDRGENTSQEILNYIAAFFDARCETDAFSKLAANQNGSNTDAQTPKQDAAHANMQKLNENLPVRPPVLCAGCPHRGSFYAVKQALGKRDAVLCGDIGCYTLGNAKPLDAVDTCLCMGAGITMAQGFSIVEPQKKAVAFVGDSTFFASALTGIVNAVYNGHDITVVMLDNATTAMTGSQPHPGTGVTLMGAHRKPVDIEGMLRAMGVECMVRANPLNLNEAKQAAAQAIDFTGPSAIIFQSPCIQLMKPQPAVHVNSNTCTGCKRCITEIGCPGIGFNADACGPVSKQRGQAYIDPSLCNGCGLCVQVCPFASIVNTDEL